MPLDFPPSPFSLYWLHATGPDGRVVLLGQYDARTRTVALVDDGTVYSADGDRLHKWRIYHIEPVTNRGKCRPPPRNPASDETDRLRAALVAANPHCEELCARADHAEAILSGLLPGPLSDALLDARNHQSRTEGVSAPCDWGRTVGRAQVLAAVQPEVEAQRQEIARLRAEAEAARAVAAERLDRLRTTAATLVEEVGSQGPEDADQVAIRAAAEIRRLRAELDAARPGVEWETTDKGLRAQRGDLVLTVSRYGWRLELTGRESCDLIVDRGYEKGDAGKKAAYAAYLWTCGLPPATGASDPKKR